MNELETRQAIVASLKRFADQPLPAAPTSQGPKARNMTAWGGAMPAFI
jgi:hypothetical protein